MVPGCGSSDDGLRPVGRVIPGVRSSTSVTSFYVKGNLPSDRPPVFIELQIRHKTLKRVEIMKFLVTDIVYNRLFRGCGLISSKDYPTDRLKE